MSDNTQARGKFQLDESKVRMILLGSAGLFAYGLYATGNFVVQKVNRLPVQGAVQAVTIAEPQIALNKLSLLMARALPAEEPAAPKRGEAVSLDRLFTTASLTASLPPEEYIAPPKLEVAAAPVEVVQAPPAVDYRDMFRSRYLLTASTDTGAFFNGRYYKVGDMIRNAGGTDPFEARLQHVGSREVVVEVNGQPASFNTRKGI